ncbi:MAG TPA: hypothetical protein VFB21_00345 [Chthonomonadaceae bacterium]|nr:hypothetical protein [Chthonomonadaceae bacterium]
MFLIDLAAERAYRGACHPALSALFFQKLVSTIRQRPKSQSARRVHHLVMIAAKQFFEIIAGDFDLPTERQNTQQRLGVRRRGKSEGLSGLAEKVQG